MISPSSLLVGTYTERLEHVRGRAAGILHVPCERPDGALGGVSVSAVCRNPSWLAVNGAGDRVYAVNENEVSDGVPGGTLSAYAFDRGRGELTLLGREPTGGVQPCHVALDPAERFLVVSNYGTGSVAVLAVGADGSLRGRTALVRHEGRGGDPLRQAGPHAHQAVFDPVTGDVLVPDLGLDAVLVYTLDDDGRLTGHADRTLHTTAGAGPRHLAFHPGGDVLFVVNELDSTITTWRRAGDRFTCVDVIDTVPPGPRSRTAPSGIRVTGSGSAVLVANRGPDTIALLRFDPGGPRLEPVSWTPVGGREPRDLALSPDGRFLHVASQDSDTVDSFAFDERALLLTRVGSTDVPTPASLVFA